MRADGGALITQRRVTHASTPWDWGDQRGALAVIRPHSATEGEGEGECKCRRDGLVIRGN